MKPNNQYLEFIVERGCYWVALQTVKKVIRSVELVHLSSENENLAGLINISGQIIPMVNIRKLLQLVPRKIDINDRIVILSSNSRIIAFIVDTIVGVVHQSDKKPDETRQILPGKNNIIECIGKYREKTIKICNSDILLAQYDYVGTHNVDDINGDAS